MVARSTSSAGVNLNGHRPPRITALYANLNYSPIVSKTFLIKRDAQDWACRAEDEIVRGIYIERNDSENFTVARALDR